MIGRALMRILIGTPLSRLCINRQLEKAKINDQSLSGVSSMEFWKERKTRGSPNAMIRHLSFVPVRTSIDCGVERTFSCFYTNQIVLFVYFDSNSSYLSNPSRASSNSYLRRIHSQSISILVVMK